MTSRRCNLYRAPTPADRVHDWVREEARCIMRRFAAQRKRESLDRGKAVRVTFNERKTLARLLFFFTRPPLSLLLSFSLSRARAPVPIEFPAGSFRLLWPIVQKTDRGSAVSFSHLVALISRRDPLHNVHLCRPAERYRDRKRTGWTPTVTFLRVSPFSFVFYRFPPSSCPTVCNMFSSIPRDSYLSKMSNDHEYGTIAVTQMFAAVRGHNLQRLSYVTACR